MNHNIQTCQNSAPCYDCWQLEATQLFLSRNKKELTKQYLNYVESMIEDGSYEEIEPFLFWVVEEKKVAEGYKKQGIALDNYEV